MPGAERYNCGHRVLGEGEAIIYSGDAVLKSEMIIWENEGICSDVLW
jgi:hypothetical protein